MDIFYMRKMALTGPIGAGCSRWAMELALVSVFLSARRRLGSVHPCFHSICQRFRQQLARLRVHGASALDAAARTTRQRRSCKRGGSSAAGQGGRPSGVPQVWFQARPLDVGCRQAGSMQRRSVERFVHCVCAAEKPASMI